MERKTFLLKKKGTKLSCAVLPHSPEWIDEDVESRKVPTQ